MKISITPILFCWCNDTPTFCHLTEFIPNQFIPEIVCPLPCSPCLFVIHCCLFIFSKHSFLSSTNATPAFSTLSFFFLQVYKKKTEMAKKDYLKQLAAYRASLVSQVTILFTQSHHSSQLGRFRTSIKPLFYIFSHIINIAGIFYRN